MSRQPSPGPSQPAAHHTAPRQKPKPHATGIAAGAEDAKYKAKYRDLKKRVKEIEGDNDKLYFKTLQAKRNIQRMRIERAILYERLSSHPASPHLLERQGYAHAHPAAPPPHPHQQRHHPHEHAYPPQEYYRGYDGVVRVVSDDGRARAAHPPPPHHARHPQQQQQQPLPTQTQNQHLEPPRAHRSASHSHSHSHSPSAGSHSRSRSRGQYAPPHPVQLPQGYAPPEHEQLLPAQLHPADRGRAISDARSPPHREASHPRVHNHQRVGPGAHINAYAAEDRERERELEWEREQERRLQARGREERQYLDVRAPAAASRSATPRSRSGSVGAHPAAGETRKRARSEEGDGEDEE